MTRSRISGVLVAVLISSLLMSCSAARHASSKPRTSPSPSPVVYVALGASETAGVGTARPERDAFPQQLLGRLGVGSVLYNLGLPGETTAQALNDELPAAVADKPQLATVFFNVDDLVAGVPPSEFQAHLDQIVGTLRASGKTTVLVANVPPLTQLPAFFACQTGSGVCPIKDTPIPSPAELAGLVQAYNAAVQQVVRAHGAILVNLAATGETLANHPEYIAADGFHPSERGAIALAQTFFAADPHR